MGITNLNLDLSERIKQCIEEEVRAYAQQHGGDILFLRVVDNIVYLKLEGACKGCPFSWYTLKMGVLSRLQKQIPAIKDVIAE